MKLLTLTRYGPRARNRMRFYQNFPRLNLLQADSVRGTWVGMERLLKLVGVTEIAKRCNEAANKHFSLMFGVEAYGAIYRELAGRED